MGSLTFLHSLSGQTSYYQVQEGVETLRITAFPNSASLSMDRLDTGISWILVQIDHGVAAGQSLRTQAETLPHIRGINLTSLSRALVGYDRRVGEVDGLHVLAKGSTSGNIELKNLDAETDYRFYYILTPFGTPSEPQFTSFRTEESLLTQTELGQYSAEYSFDALSSGEELVWLLAKGQRISDPTVAEISSGLSEKVGWLVHARGRLSSPTSALNLPSDGILVDGLRPSPLDPLSTYTLYAYKITDGQDGYVEVYPLATKNHGSFPPPILHEFSVGIEGSSFSFSTAHELSVLYWILTINTNAPTTHVLKSEGRKAYVNRRTGRHLIHLEGTLSPEANYVLYTLASSRSGEDSEVISFPFTSPARSSDPQDNTLARLSRQRISRHNFPSSSTCSLFTEQEVDLPSGYNAYWIISTLPEILEGSNLIALVNGTSTTGVTENFKHSILDKGKISSPFSKISITRLSPGSDYVFQYLFEGSGNASSVQTYHVETPYAVPDVRAEEIGSNAVRLSLSEKPKKDGVILRWYIVESDSYTETDARRFLDSSGLDLSIPHLNAGSLNLDEEQEILISSLDPNIEYHFFSTFFSKRGTISRGLGVFRFRTQEHRVADLIGTSQIVVSHSSARVAAPSSLPTRHVLSWTVIREDDPDLEGFDGVDLYHQQGKHGSNLSLGTRSGLEIIDSGRLGLASPFSILGLSPSTKYVLYYTVVFEESGSGLISTEVAAVKFQTIAKPSSATAPTLSSLPSFTPLTETATSTEISLGTNEELHWAVVLEVDVNLVGLGGGDIEAATTGKTGSLGSSRTGLHIPLKGKLSSDGTISLSGLLSGASYVVYLALENTVNNLYSEVLGVGLKTLSKADQLSIEPSIHSAFLKANLPSDTAIIWILVEEGLPDPDGVNFEIIHQIKRGDNQNIGNRTAKVISTSFSLTGLASNTLATTYIPDLRPSTEYVLYYVPIQISTYTLLSLPVARPFQTQAPSLSRIDISTRFARYRSRDLETSESLVYALHEGTPLTEVVASTVIENRGSPLKVLASGSLSGTGILSFSSLSPSSSYTLYAFSKKGDETGDVEIYPFSTPDEIPLAVPTLLRANGISSDYASFAFITRNALSRVYYQVLLQSSVGTVSSEKIRSLNNLAFSPVKGQHHVVLSNLTPNASYALLVIAATDLELSSVERIPFFTTSAATGAEKDDLSKEYSAFGFSSLTELPAPNANQHRAELNFEGGPTNFPTGDTFYWLVSSANDHELSAIHIKAEIENDTARKRKYVNSLGTDYFSEVVIESGKVEGDDSAMFSKISTAAAGNFDSDGDTYFLYYVVERAGAGGTFSYNQVSSVQLTTLSDPVIVSIPELGKNHFVLSTPDLEKDESFFWYAIKSSDHQDAHSSPFYNSHEMPTDAVASGLLRHFEEPKLLVEGLDANTEYYVFFDVADPSGSTLLNLGDLSTQTLSSSNQERINKVIADRYSAVTADITVLPKQIFYAIVIEEKSVNKEGLTGFGIAGVQPGSDKTIGTREALKVVYSTHLFDGVQPLETLTQPLNIRGLDPGTDYVLYYVEAIAFNQDNTVQYTDIGALSFKTKARLFKEIRLSPSIATYHVSEPLSGTEGISWILLRGGEEDNILPNTVVAGTGQNLSVVQHGTLSAGENVVGGASGLTNLKPSTVYTLYACYLSTPGQTPNRVEAFSFATPSSSTLPNPRFWGTGEVHSHSARFFFLLDHELIKLHWTVRIGTEVDSRILPAQIKAEGETNSAILRSDGATYVPLVIRGLRPESSYVLYVFASSAGQESEILHLPFSTTVSGTADYGFTLKYQLAGPGRVTFSNPDPQAFTVSVNINMSNHPPEGDTTGDSFYWVISQKDLPELTEENIVDEASDTVGRRRHFGSAIGGKGKIDLPFSAINVGALRGGTRYYLYAVYGNVNTYSRLKKYSFITAYPHRLLYLHEVGSSSVRLSANHVVGTSLVSMLAKRSDFLAAASAQSTPLKPKTLSDVIQETALRFAYSNGETLPSYATRHVDSAFPDGNGLRELSLSGLEPNTDYYLIHLTLPNPPNFISSTWPFLVSFRTYQRIDALSTTIEASTEEVEIAQLVPPQTELHWVVVEENTVQLEGLRSEDIEEVDLGSDREIGSRASLKVLAKGTLSTEGNFGGSPSSEEIIIRDLSRDTDYVFYFTLKDRIGTYADTYRGLAGRRFRTSSSSLGYQFDSSSPSSRTHSTLRIKSPEAVLGSGEVLYVFVQQDQPLSINKSAVLDGTQAAFHSFSLDAGDIRVITIGNNNPSSNGSLNSNRKYYIYVLKLSSGSLSDPHLVGPVWTRPQVLQPTLSRLTTFEAETDPIELPPNTQLHWILVQESSPNPSFTGADIKAAEKGSVTLGNRGNVNVHISGTLSRRGPINLMDLVPGQEYVLYTTLESTNSQIFSDRVTVNAFRLRLRNPQSYTWDKSLSNSSSLFLKGGSEIRSPIRRYFIVSPSALNFDPSGVGDNPGLISGEDLVHFHLPIGGSTVILGNGAPPTNRPLSAGSTYQVYVYDYDTQTGSTSARLTLSDLKTAPPDLPLVISRRRKLSAETAPVDLSPSHKVHWVVVQESQSLSTQIKGADIEMATLGTNRSLGPRDGLELIAKGTLSASGSIDIGGLSLAEDYVLYSVVEDGEGLYSGSSGVAFRTLPAAAIEPSVPKYRINGLGSSTLILEDTHASLASDEVLYIFISKEMSLSLSPEDIEDQTTHSTFSELTIRTGDITNITIGDAVLESNKALDPNSKYFLYLSKSNSVGPSVIQELTGWTLPFAASSPSFTSLDKTAESSEISLPDHTHVFWVLIEEESVVLEGLSGTGIEAVEKGEKRTIGTRPNLDVISKGHLRSDGKILLENLKPSTAYVLYFVTKGIQADSGERFSIPSGVLFTTAELNILPPPRTNYELNPDEGTDHTIALKGGTRLRESVERFFLISKRPIQFNPSVVKDDLSHTSLLNGLKDGGSFFLDEGGETVILGSETPKFNAALTSGTIYYIYIYDYDTESGFASEVQSLVSGTRPEKIAPPSLSLLTQSSVDTDIILIPQDVKLYWVVIEELEVKVGGMRGEHIGELKEGVSGVLSIGDRTQLHVANAGKLTGTGPIYIRNLQKGKNYVLYYTTQFATHEEILYAPVDGLAFRTEIDILSQSPTIQEPRLYPNPSQGIVYLSSESDRFEKSVRVYNSSGTLVGIFEIRDKKIDLRGLPRGIYLISLQGNLFKIALE
ncbi:MAG: T9SS type A sorting domain-containing protein [Cytophagales bacterium]|nr:T9SS type A sorting domain-containing protein [Cytophagales bacterium]